MKKKILALLLLALLLLTLPTAALAAEEITVYVTVSNQGEIAVGTDTDTTLMANVPVTVSATDGKATVDAALQEAHELYCADGYATNNSGATKLWDNSGGNYLFFVNGQGISTGVKADKVTNGDYLTASINQDNTYYADWYSSFEANVRTVAVGESIQLTLEGHLGMAMEEADKADVALSGISIGTVNATGFTPLPDKTTSSEGKVSLSFSEVGRYVVSAQGTVEDIVTAYSLMKLGGDPAVYGTMEWTEPYDTYVAYTEKDYGNGPYPASEIKYVDFDEWKEEQESYHALRSNQVIADCPIIAPVCVVTVTDPEAPHVTVRVEGDGSAVLPDTMVNLDELGEGYTAIDAVNWALSANGLAEGAKGDWAYTSFGGVSAGSDESWQFMLNDESAAVGLDSQDIVNGDRIVLYLTGLDEDYYFATRAYSYFRVAGSAPTVVDMGSYGSYPCGEISLALKKATQGSDWTWNVAPAANADIYANGSPAYTPDNALAKTDGENGAATITLWGGAEAGTYYFLVTAAVEGSAPACCRVKMVYNGTDAPVITVNAPNAADTSLTALTLAFPNAAGMSGLPYVGGAGLSVNNAVGSVQLTATAKDGGATVAMKYNGAEYTTNSVAALAVGENIFKITVATGADARVHTLRITRNEAAGQRDIPSEVAEVIDGVKTVPGGAPSVDWLLAMNAAGLQPTPAQLQTCLAAILLQVDNFAESGAGSVGAMAKTAIALTGLGIDPRQIPDPEGGPAMDLVELIYNYSGVVDPVYAAPFILSLYDLGLYTIPDNAVISRSGLISGILGAQASWTSWGVDGYGLALPALAPYYNATTAVNGIDLTVCESITTEINAAITALSAAQSIDGGFGSPNSNTAATVMLGLSAVGVNAHTDVRFIKSGSSLLTYLLSFRTSDNKLGFTDGSAADDYACAQGFQALATWENLSGPRSSNLYHFTAAVAPYTNWPDAELLTSIAVTTPPDKRVYAAGADNTPVDTAGMVVIATYNADSNKTKPIDIAACAISSIDCATPGTKTVQVAYEGQSAAFMVIVQDAAGSAPSPATVSVAVRTSGSGIIASDSSVVIEENVTTAIDVLKTVLNAKNIPYVIRNNYYVAEINGKGEFDEGANSGWLYAINGITPSYTSAHDYKLKDGDAVLWYFTLDYTKDPSSAPWTAAPPAGGAKTPFIDIANHWAYDAISYAYDNGLMQGVGGDLFAPNVALSRAMLVAILYRLAGQPAVTGSNPFSDAPAGQWYTDAVIWAAENNIAGGYGDGLFGPFDNITREQMAKMLYSYSQYKKNDVSNTGNLAAFTDAGDVSPWAAEAMSWAVAEGLITGRTASTLVPAGTATRAEAAAILKRYLEAVS